MSRDSRYVIAAVVALQLFPMSCLAQPDRDSMRTVACKAARTALHGSPADARAAGLRLRECGPGALDILIEAWQRPFTDAVVLNHLIGQSGRHTAPALFDAMEASAWNSDLAVAQRVGALFGMLHYVDPSYSGFALVDASGATVIVLERTHDRTKVPPGTRSTYLRRLYAALDDIEAGAETNPLLRSSLHALPFELVNRTLKPPPDQAP